MMKYISLSLSVLFLFSFVFLYLTETIHEAFEQISDGHKITAMFSGPRYSWFSNKNHLVQNDGKYLRFGARWPPFWMDKIITCRLDASLEAEGFDGDSVDSSWASSTGTLQP